MVLAVSFLPQVVPYPAHPPTPPPPPLPPVVNWRALYSSRIYLWLIRINVTCSLKARVPTRASSVRRETTDSQRSCLCSHNLTLAPAAKAAWAASSRPHGEAMTRRRSGGGETASGCYLPLDYIAKHKQLHLPAAQHATVIGALTKR